MRNRFFSLPSEFLGFVIAFFLVLLATPVHAQTVPVFTPAQIAAQCQSQFSLSVRQGETDALATVQTYQVRFTVDAGTALTSIATSCSGTISPYACSGTYTVPAVGQTAGNHTLHISVLDPADGSVSTVIDAPYTVRAPLGPVPPPTNWKFIIGSVIAGVIAAIVAFTHHG